MSYFHPGRMPLLSARRRQAARRQLEEWVVRSARSRPRRAPVLVAVVVAVVALSTGAAGVIAYHAITNKRLARCYTVTNLNASAAYYTTVTEASVPTKSAEVRNMHDACAALYRIGMLTKGRPIPKPPWAHGNHSVPRLAVCVSHHGTAWVFPGGRGTCAKLGLAAAARRLSRLTPPAAWYGGPGSLSQIGAAVP